MTIEQRIASLTEHVRELMTIAETTFERRLVYIAEAKTLLSLFRLALRAMIEIEATGMPCDFDADWREMRLRLAYVATKFSRILSAAETTRPAVAV